MCEDIPVPLVCTSAYLQMCIYTEAHSNFDFCSYLGRILSHVVLAFGLPVICLFWIHLVNVLALQRQGYVILFFFFVFYPLLSPSVLQLQLCSMERGNTKAPHSRTCGRGCIWNTFLSSLVSCSEEIQHTYLGSSKFVQYIPANQTDKCCDNDHSREYILY